MKTLSTFAAGLFAVSSLVSFNAQALTSVSHTVKVGSYYTFGYGNGTITNDAWIKISSDTTGSSATDCPGGYWISAAERAAHPEWEAMLIGAFHSKSNVYIGAYNDTPWPGTNGVNTCQIHSVGLVE